jgi:ADP-heptose:LPS heptosyltransferase
VAAVVLNQIGDAVLSLPTIEAVQRMCPSARVTVVAGRAVAPLLRAHRGGAFAVREFDALWQKVVCQLLGRARRVRDVAGAMREFVRLVTGLRPDAVIAFQPDPVVNHLLGLTGVRHTFAFVEAGAGFRLGHPVRMPRSGHQAARTFALARAFAEALGAEAPPFDPPRLEVDGEAVARAAGGLAAAGVDPGRIVVLHPFASAETKNWPMERWRAVAGWLEEAGYVPAVVGGGNDPIETCGLPHRSGVGGRLPLPDLAALLVLARLFVGVDSGPGHIAAAVGCPVVSIFSSVNDVDRWRPFARKADVAVLHQPAADPRLPAEVRTLPPGAAGNPYLDGVGVDDVIREIKRLLTA